MYEVVIADTFRASHSLRLPGGSAEPSHRHDWNIRVTYAGPDLDSMDMLVDFTVVRPMLQALLTTMADRDLNELPIFATQNPSAERVAEHIANQLMKDETTGFLLSCVEVEEEPGCFARFMP